MLSTALLDHWQAGLADGSIVPFLGPDVLADVRSTADGRPMPATSEQLILAMNNGQPMAPKLMYEFPRAAMNIELKRGRSAVTRFLDTTYGTTAWTRAALHDWLAEIYPPYVIDINRDTQAPPLHFNAPSFTEPGNSARQRSRHCAGCPAYCRIDFRSVTQSSADRHQICLRGTSSARWRTVPTRIMNVRVSLGAAE